MNGRVTCVGVPARRRGTRVICYFRRRVCTWTGTERIGRPRITLPVVPRIATLCVIAYNVGAFFGIL